MPADINPLLTAFTHTGERALGITKFHCCEGKSFSGPILAQPDTHVRALHCNGLHPSPPEGVQDAIYMMRCSPLSAPMDLKVLLKEGISKLYSPDQVHIYRLRGTSLLRGIRASTFG